MKLQGMEREFDHQDEHYRIDAHHVTDDPLTYDCHIFRRLLDGTEYEEVDLLTFLPENPEGVGQSNPVVDETIRQLLEIAQERFTNSAAEIEQHLIDGGLQDLLRNHQGAQAWLRRNDDGTFTHTFVDPSQDRPSANVPLSCTDQSGTRIFGPHEAQVRTFLSDLGVTDDSVDRIVEDVGTGT